MLEVYITDLTAYNNGMLVGEWVTLPIEAEELTTKIQEILKTGEQLCTPVYGYETHEEVFISDSNWEECDIFKVHLYDNLIELNNRVEPLGDMTDTQHCAVKFLLSQGCVSTLEEAIEQADEVQVYKDTQMREVAYEQVQEVYDIHKLPSIISDNIDYERIGQDLLTSGYYYQIGTDIYEYHN